MISDICESFGCLPDEAERQDDGLVLAVLEYRAARAAFAAFQDVKHGYDTFQRNPGLATILAQMRRAQVDEVVTEDQIYEALRRRREGGPDAEFGE